MFDGVFLVMNVDIEEFKYLAFDGVLLCIGIISIIF